jgi:putative alpha-1,2-mannosidase
MPLYDRMLVHLKNGHVLELTTTQNLPQYQFLDAVELNGEVTHKPYITHSELMTTQHLDYTLGLVPNPENFDETIVPYSLTAH